MQVPCVRLLNSRRFGFCKVQRVPTGGYQWPCQSLKRRDSQPPGCECMRKILEAASSRQENFTRFSIRVRRFSTACRLRCFQRPRKPAGAPLQGAQRFACGISADKDRVATHARATRGIRSSTCCEVDDEPPAILQHLERSRELVKVLGYLSAA